MKCPGIYAIRCRNRIYVGQAVDIAARWSAHLADLSRGRHVNKRLQEDFRRHGCGSLFFTILELCSIDDLDNCERKHILTLRDDDYNVMILKHAVPNSPFMQPRSNLPRAPLAKTYRAPRLIVELIPTEPGWTVRPRDIAQALHITENTLVKHGTQGYGPAFARFDGEIRYDEFWNGVWSDRVGRRNGPWPLAYTTPDGAPLTERARMNALGFDTKVPILPTLHIG